MKKLDSKIEHWGRSFGKNYFFIHKLKIKGPIPEDWSIEGLGSGVSEYPYEFGFSIEVPTDEKKDYSEEIDRIYGILNSMVGWEFFKFFFLKGLYESPFFVVWVFGVFERGRRPRSFTFNFFTFKKCKICL